MTRVGAVEDPRPFRHNQCMAFLHITGSVQNNHRELFGSNPDNDLVLLQELVYDKHD